VPGTALRVARHRVAATTREGADMGIAHWDDVEWHRRAKGEMDAEWQRLGDSAGTTGVGVNRVRVAPGRLPTPPHSHGASEELYYVLGGAGLAWQDEAVHAVRAGDCVIHRPDEMEHTFVAGPDGLDLLVFGTRHSTELGWLPRSRAVRIGWPWVEGRTDDPWEIEAQAPPLKVGEPAPRPANIVNVDEVELERFPGGDHGAAGDARALATGRTRMGADRGRRHGRATALPLRRGGGVRDPGGRGPASAVALAAGNARRQRARRRGGAARSCDRAAGRQAHRPLLPGRRKRCDDADLRHPQAQRYVLVSPLQQDLLARLGRDRADRSARVHGW
jgi:uncharacterized cupin superfamily protein